MTAKGEQASGGEAKIDPIEDVIDRFTVIKGIVPSIQTELESFSIMSLAALAASDPETLAEKLSASQPISVARVKGWIEDAWDRVMERT